MGPLLTESDESWPAGCCGIHAVHMTGGKFLLWGYGPAGQNAYTNTWVWDSFTGNFTGPHPVPGAKVFCCGVSQLPDGRPIIAGGTDTVAGVGINKTYVFNPATSNWTQQGVLNQNRWYPALPTLADGTVVAVSGWVTPNPAVWVSRVDVFSAAAGTWADFAPTFASSIPEPIQPHFYPFMFAYRDPAEPTVNKLFFAGKKTANFGASASSLLTYTLKFNGTTAAEWAPLGGSSQIEGSGAVMMIDGTFPVVAGKIYKFGGVNPQGPIASGRMIDLNLGAQATWQGLTPMTTARNQCNIVAMPNGMIAVGGGADDYAPHSLLTEAIKTIQIYNPATNTWFDESPDLADARMYHSTASMTPNATIMTFGGEYIEAQDPEVNICLYSAQEYFPPYFQIDSIRTSRSTRSGRLCSPCCRRGTIQ